MKNVYKILSITLIIQMLYACSNDREPTKAMSYYNNITIKSLGNQVDDLELNELKLVLPTFPTGYSEFIKTFGRGFIGDGLSILTPREILRDNFLSYKAQRQFRKEYWFWEEYGYKSDFFDAFVAIASSDDGDIYLVGPVDPDNIYRLMHDSGVQITAGGVLGLLKTRAEMDKDEIDWHKRWFIFEGH